MSRSKTTSIKRPKLPPASEEGESRLGDWSRPIPVDKRISRRPKVALAAGIGALVVGGALAAAVFVLPVQTWFDQDEALTDRQAQLDELQRVNNQLAAEVERLGTPDGIREAAREEIGYIGDGEQRFSVMPLPPLPRTLPIGWPYSVTSSILAARSAGPAPAETPQTTTPASAPTTPATTAPATTTPATPAPDDTAPTTPPTGAPSTPPTGAPSTPPPSAPPEN